eukprot:TRINITY_DN32783_c0_g1_i1.p1 TRINITY_DN32783_c0_g1~~TRINITY_DN32783_c0_g1_i1.p1  ORF type:complete len:530 (+),score=25.07 TRINITY_DN32783_c0_g1_i1:427-2016(+)
MMGEETGVSANLSNGLPSTAPAHNEPFVLEASENADDERLFDGVALEGQRDPSPSGNTENSSLLSHTDNGLSDSTGLSTSATLLHSKPASFHVSGPRTPSYLSSLHQKWSSMWSSFVSSIPSLDFSIFSIVDKSTPRFSLWILAGCLPILVIILLSLFVFFSDLRGGEYNIGDLRMNQIQMIGTHNSYHQQQDAELLKVVGDHDPYWPILLEYNHASIPEQLAGGCRFFELDVFEDPEGGRYANHAINRLLGRPHTTPDPELLEPGFKVLHMQDIDFLSSCKTLKICLSQIANFSQNHPRHFPIGVRIEFKHKSHGWPPGHTDPVPLSKESLIALEDEIRLVFEEADLVLPDDVLVDVPQEEQSPEALLRYKLNWPTLSAAAGKVFLFLISNEPIEMYLTMPNFPRGRIMFAAYRPLGPSDPAIRQYPAFLPVRPQPFISNLVKADAWVMSAVDVNTEEARMDDPSRLHEAITRGANILMTDYPPFEAPNPFGTNYAARLPGGLQVRCNPVNAPPWCSGIQYRLREPLP